MKTLRTFVAFSLMAAGAFALPTNAFAMMANSPGDGLNNCLLWCPAHNKTESSLRQWETQCAHYWGKHKGFALRDQ